MNDELVERILSILRKTKPFHSLPVRNRPLHTLWDALDATLLKLRLPIYHVKLGKPKPKQALHDEAIQHSLALLSAFAVANGTHQVVISCEHGRARSISFQPRPLGYNWTATHALQAQKMENEQWVSYKVTIDDFMFLAVKCICAIAGYQAGVMRDAVATIEFGWEAEDNPAAVVVTVREKHPQVHTAYFK